MYPESQFNFIKKLNFAEIQEKEMQIIWFKQFPVQALHRQL